MTWRELINSGELDGFAPFAGNDIDQSVVDEYPCDCGGKMIYRPMRDKAGTYRAFAVCTVCHEVQEF